MANSESSRWRFTRTALASPGTADKWESSVFGPYGIAVARLSGPARLPRVRPARSAWSLCARVNGGEREDDATRPVLLAEFVDKVYLPFQRGKWKASTAWTSENRIQHHIVKELGNTALESFTLKPLQEFLERKAAAGLSFSIVNHLRWDLSSIFEMAVAEKVIVANPATRLYTPKSAEEGERRVMNGC